MAGLDTLRKEAEETATARGHSIRWVPPYHGERNSLQQGYCVNCGAWAQVDTCPLPNGIDIGGPAVAVDCGSPLGECDTLDGWADTPEGWRDYDALAEYVAGLRTRKLPVLTVAENLGNKRTRTLIGEDPEAFEERVRAFSYAAAMGKHSVGETE